MVGYIKWWVAHWYNRIYNLRWVIIPPVIAAMIVPEDGNMIVYLMVYCLGWTSAICAFYELQQQDKEHARKEKDESKKG